MQQAPHRLRLALPVLAVLAALMPRVSRAADPYIPVLVPVTGFLATEGRSQRNGALLALRNPPAGGRVRFDVSDTGTSPEVAVNAMERAASGGDAIAAVAPILGTQMLALLPLAKEIRLPLLTISGTASLTRQGNPYVFRFFPEDAVTKTAQMRYALEERGFKRPAVIYQTTAYGQSGHEEITRLLGAAGITPPYQDGLDVSVRDMLPVLAKVRASGADSVILHLHAGPTALLLKAAAAIKLDLPIIAGSGLAQPSTTALLEPAELAGVCAETGSSPISGGDPGVQRFLDEYRRAFDSEPDAFALAQYDGTVMALNAIAAGARTPDALAAALATGRHQGLAGEYRSDGKGNMAHSAMVVCWDRGTRVPSVVKRYDMP